MDAVAVLVFELQPPLAGAVVHGVVVVLLAVADRRDVGRVEAVHIRQLAERDVARLLRVRQGLAVLELVDDLDFAQAHAVAVSLP